MKPLNKPNLQTAAQNRALFEELRRIKSQDDKPGADRVRKKIVEENLGLIYHYVNRYQWVEDEGRLELGDLVGAGVEGMYKAIDQFDVTLGFTFSTYARNWIQNHINRAIRGAEIVKVYRGWLPKGALVSLDAPSRKSESARTRHEITAGDGPSPEDLTADAETSEILNRASRAACLVMGKHASTVATARFRDDRVMPDIARELGVSRQRVDQVEKRFIRVIRQELRRTG